MNPHFLVNISSDTENHYGVRFLCSFFQESGNCDVTLFHICRLNSIDSTHSLTEMWDTPDNRIEGKLTIGAKKALEKATRILTSNGIPIHQMKTKSVEERFGKVKDILAEGNEGLYDAMILGRRATYALQWLFDRPGDEIPLALAKDNSLVCPVWVCCEPEQGRKNVLLCVDGSESALHMADHVGYILSFAKDHNVTVFHVASPASDNSDTILQPAIDMLRSHNIEHGRIKRKCRWGLSVAGTILNEKNNGKFAAVAVGLHGIGKRKSDHLGQLGGTTSTLINKIVKATLWCCP